MVVVDKIPETVPERNAASVIVQQEIQGYFQRQDVIERLEEDHGYDVDSEQNVKRALDDLRKMGVIELDGRTWRVVR